MEGNEESQESDIEITGPKGFKVKFKNPKLQIVIALVVGFCAGIGVMSWPW